MISFFRCLIRFPSTNIRLEFTSLVEDVDQAGDNEPTQPSTSRHNRIPLPPLRINIPDSEMTFGSPLPSPTGTIRFVQCAFDAHQNLVMEITKNLTLWKFYPIAAI